MRRFHTIAALLLALLIAAPASAVNIEHITRLSGNHTNVLTGLGLVIGLKGTGDGGDFQPAIKPLAAMLTRFADPATVKELGNASNVALVSVTVTVPEKGALKGDQLDVQVMSIGAAKSIHGGQLFVTPLLGPTGQLSRDNLPFAFARGTVVAEDSKIPTTGVIKNGAVLEEDLPTPSITNGIITLVLDGPSAGWTTADTIAKIVNDAEGNGDSIAIAVNAKAVKVSIPTSERMNPANFISRVQRLPVPVLNGEARVVINQRTGTIIMTGDVEISPVVISHKGLTITTINPRPKPTERTPETIEKRTIGLDTTSQGGAKLQELVDALDLIKVPAEDRITIIEQLYKTGKLHAKLIIE